MSGWAARLVRISRGELCSLRKILLQVAHAAAVARHRLQHGKNAGREHRYADNEYQAGA
jgi:hypothetical protein